MEVRKLWYVVELSLFHSNRNALMGIKILINLISLTEQKCKHLVSENM